MTGAYFLSFLCFAASLILSIISATWWIIKNGGLSKVLGKHEPVREDQSASLPAEPMPRNIIDYLLTQHFYLGLPLVQGLLTYLVCVIYIRLTPDQGEVFILILFTVFSILSPIINLFAPHWWLNTGLFLLSWYLLFSALISTLEAHFGPLGAGAIGFFLPMFSAAMVLPLTALIKLIMFIIKNRAIHDKLEGVDTSR